MPTTLQDIYTICTIPHDTTGDFASCGNTHVSKTWYDFKERLGFEAWKGDEDVIERFVDTNNGYDLLSKSDDCDTAYIYRRMSDGQYEGVSLLLWHNKEGAAVSAFCTRNGDGSQRGQQAGEKDCLVGGACWWEMEEMPSNEIANDFLGTLQRIIEQARQNLQDRHKRDLPAIFTSEAMLSGTRHPTLLTPLALLDQHPLTGNPSLERGFTSPWMGTYISTSPLKIILRLSAMGLDIESHPGLVGSVCEILTGIAQYVCSDIHVRRMYDASPAAMAITVDRRVPGPTGADILAWGPWESSDKEGFEDQWLWQTADDLSGGWHTGLPVEALGVAGEIRILVAQAIEQISLAEEERSVSDESEWENDEDDMALNVSMSELAL